MPSEHFPEDIRGSTEAADIEHLKDLTQRLSFFLDEKMRTEELRSFAQELETDDDTVRKVRFFCSKDDKTKKRLVALEKRVLSGGGDPNKNAHALRIISLLIPDPKLTSVDGLFRKVFGSGVGIVEEDDVLRRDIFGEDQGLLTKKYSTHRPTNGEYTTSSDMESGHAETPKGLGTDETVSNLAITNAGIDSSLPRDEELSPEVDAFRTAISWVSDFLEKGSKYDGVEELLAHLKSDQSFAPVRRFCALDQPIKIRLEEIRAELNTKAEKDQKDQKILAVVEALLLDEQDTPQTLIGSKEQERLGILHDVAVRSRYFSINEQSVSSSVEAREDEGKNESDDYIEEFSKLLLQEGEGDEVLFFEKLAQLFKRYNDLFGGKNFSNLSESQSKSLQEIFAYTLIKLSKCNNQILARLYQQKISEIDGESFSGRIRETHHAFLRNTKQGMSEAFLDTVPGSPDLDEVSVLHRLDKVPQPKELIGLCLEAGCSSNLLTKIEAFFEGDEKKQSALLQFIYLLSKPEVLDGYLTRNEDAFLQEEVLRSIYFPDEELGSFLRDKREVLADVDQRQLSQDQISRLNRLGQIINVLANVPQGFATEEAQDLLEKAAGVVHIDEKTALSEAFGKYKIERNIIESLSVEGFAALSKIALLCDERYQREVYFGDNFQQAISTRDHDLIISAMGESSFARLFTDTGFISLIEDAKESLRKVSEAKKVAEPDSFEDSRKRYESVERLFARLSISIGQANSPSSLEIEKNKLTEDINSLLEKVETGGLQLEDVSRMEDILYRYRYSPSEEILIKIRDLYKKADEKFSEIIDINYVISGENSLSEEQLSLQTVLRSVTDLIKLDGTIIPPFKEVEEKPKEKEKPFTRLKKLFTTKSRLKKESQRDTSVVDKETDSYNTESVYLRENLAKKGAALIYQKYKDLPLTKRLAITAALMGASVGASLLAPPAAAGVMAGVFVGKTILRGFSAAAAGEFTTSVMRPKLERKYLEKYKDEFDKKGIEKDQLEAFSKAKAEKNAKRFGVAAGLTIFLLGEAFDVTKFIDSYSPVSGTGEIVTQPTVTHALEVESIANVVPSDMTIEVTAGQTLEGILKQPDVLDKLVDEVVGKVSITASGSFAQENYVQNIIRALNANPNLLKEIGLEHSRSVNEIYPGDKINLSKLAEIVDSLKVTVAGENMSIAKRALQMVNRLH